jgi:hypothetical protein
VKQILKPHAYKQWEPCFKRFAPEAGQGTGNRQQVTVRAVRRVAARNQYCCLIPVACSLPCFKNGAFEAG